MLDSARDVMDGSALLIHEAKEALISPGDAESQQRLAQVRRSGPLEGYGDMVVLQAGRLSSSFCQTAAPVPRKLTTSNVLQQNSAGCQNRNILTACESMRILLL